MSRIDSIDVARIQRLLNRDHGHDLTVDGYFGRRDFWDRGKTVQAILDTLVKHGGPINPVNYGPKIVSYDVADIQRLLNRDHGYNLKVDGDFGPRTFWDNGKTVQAVLDTLLKLGGKSLDEEPDKPETQPQPSGRRVFIEIGHGPLPGGGHDPGAVRLGTNVTEHELNKEGAAAMATRLGQLGIACTVGDPRAGNYHSGQAAKGFDLMISFHHNSHFEGSKAQGTEAISDPCSRNPRSDARLSRFVSAAMAKALGIPDRGHKQMRLSVLSGARSVGVPYSSLLEAYFVQRRPDDNPATAEMEDWSRRAGVAAAEGVAEFLADLDRRLSQQRNAS